MKKDIKFKVKIFWPRRSDAKGFSIENLARKYHHKISRVSSNEDLNQLIDNRNLKSSKENIKDLGLPHLSLKRGHCHWANRDFSEYRDVA